MKGDDGIVVPEAAFLRRVESISALTLDVIAAQIAAVAATPDLDRRYTRAIFLRLISRYLVGCNVTARAQFIDEIRQLREAADQDEKLSPAKVGSSVH